MHLKTEINPEGLLIPDWPAPNKVRALCTTRISFQPADTAALSGYALFNLALHVGDESDKVQAHRKQLADYIKLSERDIAWLEQVHGTALVTAESACQSNDTKPLQADASITAESRKACTIMTADCLPVLFCNLPGQDEKQLVAAAHAGWRGLASGILSKTLSRFPKPEHVIAWLGPAISQKHFEVGHEVYRAFVEKNPHNKKAFIAANSAAQQASLTHEAKWMACLYTLATLELQAAGIQAIYGGGHCTVEEQNLFYSYRRDGARSGRMASLIFME